MKKLNKDEVILFPTDTVIGIGCILGKKCIEKLRKITERPENKPFAILLSDIEDIQKWVKEIPPVFRKLSNFIPGPLTLIFKGKESLPVGVLSVRGTVGIRIPDDEPLLEIIKEAGYPLVATSANISGKPPPFHTGDVELDYDIIIDGSGKSNIPSTILDISEKKSVLIRKGEISILEIEKTMTQELILKRNIDFNILFVCSANMCRSPLAEAHLKTLTHDLPFVKIRSAGISAMHGAPISIGANKILEENKIEFRHRASRIEKPILSWADIIFIMEEKHKNYLLEFSPESKSKIVFLGDFKDKNKERQIEDPAGKGIEEYRRIYQKIVESNKRVDAYLRRKYRT